MKQSLGRQGLVAAVLAVALATTAPGCAADSAAGARTDIGTGERAAPGCRAGVASDVNGDGYADVAVGAPGDNQQRGSVHLFYGHRGRLMSVATGSAPDDLEITQDSPDIPDAGEVGDRFGSTVALADLNGDHCADLVVGARHEDGIGSITVLYGSPDGLRTAGSVQFGVTALFGAAAATHRPDAYGYLDRDAYSAFGDTLAFGDLDGDGITDLAAAWAPANVDSSVAVLYGSRAGVGAGRPTVRLGLGQLGLTSGGIWSMATGDFDGDHHPELALGGGDGVAVVSARAGVFTPRGRITEKTPGLPKAPKNNRYVDFGDVAAAGDINGDGRDDLVVTDSSSGMGEPESEYGKGLIVVLPGSAKGLTTAGSQLWTQDSPGVAGRADYGNWFGRHVAIGSLDGDRYADVAISSVGFRTSQDSVTVLRGGPRGLSVAGYGGTAYSQRTAGIAGTSEPGDTFGGAVSVARLGGAGAGALVIGAPGEDVDAIADAGSITQLGASTSGPRPDRSQTLTLDSPGVTGTSGRAGEFGFGLS